MPIEFRCTQCHKLLRTGDGTAGKRAKCPACGNFMTVPYPDAEADFPVASVAYQPGAPEDTDNPYQSPRQAGQPPRQPYYRSDPFAAAGVRARVSGPATGLIVTGVLGMALHVLLVFDNLMNIGLFALGDRPREIPFEITPQIAVIAGAVGIVLSIVVLLGAVKMKNLENYGLAMTASIIALVPCTSPFCLLGFPFGIWALVVLCDEPVRAAFGTPARR